MDSVANCHSRMLYNRSVLEVEHIFCLCLKGSGMQNQKVIAFLLYELRKLLLWP